MNEAYRQLKGMNYFVVCDLIPKELINEMYAIYMDHYNRGDYDEGLSPPMLGTAIELKGRTFMEPREDKSEQAVGPFKKTEALLSNWLQENMGMRTAPTYNMGRIYNKGTIGMFKHVDRLPCEVSVTLPIAYDQAPWDITVEDSTGTDVPVSLHVGDVLFYSGCVANHHRKNDSLNKFHIQHYFHFMDLDSEAGSFWNYFRSDTPHQWPGALDAIMEDNGLPLMSEEDKIRYSKLIGEYNV
tara:strand:+ start:2541 stop:3263 length:723 start_codon:yes stop_codon:yes gene_type:complete